jgi:hypothetical protein
MKSKFIQGFVALVVLTITMGASCEKVPIEEPLPQPSAPTFMVGTGVSTMVFTPTATNLFVADFYSISGGDRILFADVTITPENGGKTTDITNSVLSFRKDNDRDSVVIPFSAPSSNTFSVDLSQYGMILATKQNVEVRVRAHLNPAHKATFRVAVRLRYSGLLGPGTLSQSGPIISCQAGGISVEILGGKNVQRTTLGKNDTLQIIKFTTYGRMQRIEISHDAVGLYKNETIGSLNIFDEQGVQVGNSAPNMAGKFYVSNIVQDSMLSKTYYVTSMSQNGAQTGHEFGVRLTTIRSRDVVTNIISETTHNVVGNKFVAYEGFPEIVRNPLPTNKLANGKQVYHSITITMRGGSGTFSQLKNKIIVADNGLVNNLELKNLGVIIAGTDFSNASFSFENGDSAKVIKKGTSEVYYTLVGGYNFPKDVPIKIDFVGLNSGTGGAGDGISTETVFDEEINLDSRHLTMAPNESIARLDTKMENSSSGKKYAIIFSDEITPAIPGISPPKFTNSFFIVRKNFGYSVLQ